MAEYDNDPRNPAREPRIEPSDNDVVQCERCNEYFRKADLETPITKGENESYESIEYCEYCRTHSSCCGAEMHNYPESDICPECKEHC